MARVGGDGEAGTEMEIQGLGGTGAAPSLSAGTSGGDVSMNLAARFFPEEPQTAATPRSGNEIPEAEPSMKDLMREMRNMSVNLGQRIDGMSSNLGQRIDSIQVQFENLKNDLKTLQSETVTKVVFQSLEERVSKLEAGGVPKPETKWLQMQVNRLDPANKSLCFRDFTTTDAAKRVAAIEATLANLNVDSGIRRIEHIWTGPRDKRVMSTNTIVELSSRDLRESCLKQLNEDNSKMVSAEVGPITVGRAKTSLQMNRNSGLYRVEKLLKEDPKNKGKSVAIIWQIESSKNRGVSIDGALAFVQCSSDISGKFLAPFEDWNL